jgi:hypothetical protein
MPIDDAQKEVLRKRLELARASKVAKKQKIDNVQAVSTEQVVEKSIEPLEPVPPKIEEPKEEPLITKKTSALTKKDSPQAKKNDKKDRYAKLVFYKDPSNKTIKKMTSILASSDEDEPAKAPTKHVQIKETTVPLAPVIKPQIDPRILRQQQISNLSKRFFDC